MTKGLGNPTPTKYRMFVHTSRLSDYDEMSTEPSNSALIAQYTLLLGKFNETERRKPSFVKQDIPQDIGLLNPMAHKEIAKKRQDPHYHCLFRLTG